MRQRGDARGAAVTLAGVSKRFGQVAALADVTLTLAPGSVHALVGQNGAGKSTCLGIIAGRIPATSGTVTVGDRRWPSAVAPAYARAAGVSAIYQELSVVPAMSALDNVFLGSLQSRAGTVAGRAMRRRYAEISERLGVAIDPRARAGELSVADQQMLEIMRALTVESKVVLLDEPTAALAPPEREALFSVMRDLRAKGLTMIFVSHYLDEVMANADTVTVFRDGRLIESAPIERWDEPRMVRAMLGEELQALQDIDAAAPGARATGRAALRVEGLFTREGLADISMTVGRGEIVGLAGLVGSGRSRLVRALAGLGRGVTGRLWLDGREVGVPSTPRKAWERGISVVPEDRKRAGLVMTMSSRDNIMIGDLRPCSRAGIMRPRRLRQRSSELARRYGLEERMLDRPARELSGGNQQKLLLARWGNRVPTVLLADEATRGIDIGAKRRILMTLRELADSGLGVVFVSSELEEVTAASDRVYVMRGGRVVGHMERTGGRMAQDSILERAFGLEVTPR